MAPAVTVEFMRTLPPTVKIALYLSRQCSKILNHEGIDLITTLGHVKMEESIFSHLFEMSRM